MRGETQGQVQGEVQGEGGLVSYLEVLTATAADAAADTHQ